MTESQNRQSSTRSPSAAPGRTRVARVACKACHARRVKCDAADGQPCWHCRTRDVTYMLGEVMRNACQNDSRRRLRLISTMH
ncbi:hypothetical protein LB505_012970 [Fusarium chuoi]|nr:hypothetical protein LB505_012970 [Fusarium chuoi]